MEVIQMPNNKKLNRKKLTIAIIVAVVVLIFIILFIVYSANRSFREAIDKYVLMKNIVEDSTTAISLEESDNNIIAYDKYICILSKNTLTNYSSSGNKEGEIQIEITNPIIASGGKFLLIAERDKSKIYLISGNEILWEKDLEGNIDLLAVNKNGYSSVVLSGTTYKSVIETFDVTGDELFKTYLSSTLVMDVDISTDNQYLAFAEINTNGTMAKSIIKTVSIQKARNKQKDTSQTDSSFTKSYEMDEGKLVTNIKYQDGNRLVCMYDTGINVIKNDENDEIITFKEDGAKVSFADIELSSNVYRIIEKSSLLSAQTNVEIVNTPSKKINAYTFDGVAKECCSYDDTIAINIGSEVHFISTNGWLIRKYISTQEVQKVIMANNFAGIIYRNKIEIVNL